MDPTIQVLKFEPVMLGRKGDGLATELGKQHCEKMRTNYCIDRRSCLNSV